LREIYTDAVEWPDSTLNQWVNDGLADYSNYFGLEETEVIATVCGLRRYDLACRRIISVIGVEYPEGQDPPRLLTYREASDPRGFYGGPYYGIIGNPPLSVVLGELPNGLDSISIRYLRVHDLVYSDADPLTIPIDHEELLVLYVAWQVMAEAHAQEVVTTDPQSLLLSMLSMDVQRAERLYRTKLGALMELRGSRNNTVALPALDRWQWDRWA